MYKKIMLNSEIIIIQQKIIIENQNRNFIAILNNIEKIDYDKLLQLEKLR